MDNERVEIVMVPFQLEVRNDMNFGHYFTVLLLLDAVLESFDADNEVVRALAHSMPFDRLTSNILTLSLRCRQWSHSRPSITSSSKLCRIVSVNYYPSV